MSENNVLERLARLEERTAHGAKEIDRLRGEMKSEMASSSYSAGAQAMLTKIVVISSGIAAIVAAVVTKLLPSFGL